MLCVSSASSCSFFLSNQTNPLYLNDPSSSFDTQILSPDSFYSGRCSQNSRPAHSIIFRNSRVKYQKQHQIDTFSIVWVLGETVRNARNEICISHPWTNSVSRRWSSSLASEKDGLIICLWRVILIVCPRHFWDGHVATWLMDQTRQS